MEPEPAVNQAPMRIIELTAGTRVSQALSVAATLGVADELASGPRAVGEIATAVGADAPTLYRLLRALADIEVFRELDGQRFALTGISDLLRSDVPGSLRGWATMVGTPWHRDAWTGLLESVRTGESAFERVHRQLGFDYFGDHPDDAEVLNDAMTSVSRLVIAPIVESYDFASFGTVVDVGGGHGALLAEVLAANPEVHGVLYDLPHVIAGAGQPLDDADVGGRCSVPAGTSSSPCRRAATPTCSPTSSTTGTTSVPCGS